MQDLSSTAISEAQKSAFEVFKNYSFKYHEVWRWTPSEALFQKRQLALADYEFYLNDQVQEDFGTDDHSALTVIPHAPLLNLNLAILAEASKITVPAHHQSEEINTIWVKTDGQNIQPSRIQLTIGEQSQSAFWLDYSAENQSAQLPVVQVTVEAGAELDLVVCLRGDNQTAQSAFISVIQNQDSKVRLNVVQAHKGWFQRIDIHNEIIGTGADFQLGGVQCQRARDVADIHVNIRHQAEECTSSQTIRGALTEQSLGIFDGMIYVAHGSQKTDAKQDSRYIILSDEAQSHSVPRLEIYADDVQCAHGSTTGKLDEEALFYLQSRGINRQRAEALLISSFLLESVVVQNKELAERLYSEIQLAWTGEEEDHLPEQEA